MTRVQAIPGAIALSLLSLLVLPARAQRDPGGTWLDEDANWNQVRATIPTAPALEGNNLSFCQETLRSASLPEDEQVEAAGWTLSGAAHVFSQTTLITGMADADGMCRPLQYQVFVFNAGEFVGTLSPVPMDSRTDGSLFRVELYGEGSIDASFNRYTPEDALCCASGESRLFYQLDIESNTPVVIPQLPATTTTRPEVE